MLLGRTKLESTVRYLGIDVTMHWILQGKPKRNREWPEATVIQRSVAGQEITFALVMAPNRIDIGGVNIGLAS